MKSGSIIFFCLLLFATGCMDQCTPRKNISGPYYLTKNETGTWELNYDLGGGNGIGRVNSVKQIGWTEKYIITKYDSLYYFIDKSRDSIYYNAEYIVIGPLDGVEIKKLIDSLKITDFKFQMNLK